MLFSEQPNTGSHPFFPTNRQINNNSNVSWKKNLAPGEIYSLIARKKLHLNESTIKLPFFCNLRLKRTTIKTILKKQFCKRISSDLLSNEDLVSFGETVGYKLKSLVLKPKSEYLDKHELKQYHKIMASSKQLDALSIQSYMHPPVCFLKRMRINKSLTNLSKYLFYDQFINLPYFFNNFSHLKKLTLQLIYQHGSENINNKKASISFTNFTKYLSTLKNLEILVLQIPGTIFYGNEEGAMKLFSALEDMNLAYFKLTISISDQTLIPSKMEKFLSKVDSLLIQQSSSHRTSFNSKRSLYLANREGKFDPHEIIIRCSSLRNLHIESQAIGNNVPQELGLAKHITEFSMNLQELSDEEISSHLFHLCKMLQQANSLEKFSLSLLSFQDKPLEAFGHLHKLLSQTRIKHYKLDIDSVSESTNFRGVQLQNILSQIVDIESLESLSLFFDRIEDLQPFKILFKGLPNLLSLEIKILSELQSDAPFPFDDLAQMLSLEKLCIKLPKFDKSAALTVLPRIKNIKELYIGLYLSFRGINSITMDDYVKLHSTYLQK